MCFAVRAQPFFASINWDALVRRQIKPEFVPSLQVARLRAASGAFCAVSLVCFCEHMRAQY